MKYKKLGIDEGLSPLFFGNIEQIPVNKKRYINFRLYVYKIPHNYFTPPLTLLGWNWQPNILPLKTTAGIISSYSVVAAINLSSQSAL